MDALLYVLGILIVLAGIALSIGLHEIGHLVPAKIFGVRVTQYMIGFGPTIWSLRKGETEYGVKAIPLGGYILMSGMYPPAHKPYRGPFAKWITEARREIDKEQGDLAIQRQFYALTAWKKLIIMFGGPAMNLVLGTALIVASVAGIGPMQPTLEIAKVYQCIEGETCVDSAISPAAKAGLAPGDKISSVNGQDVNSWEETVEVLNQDQGASVLGVTRDDKQLEIAITPVFTERQVFDESGVALKDQNGLPITEIRPVIGVQLKAENTPESLQQAFGYATTVVSGTFGFILDLPNQVYKVALSTFGVADRDPAGAVSIVGVGQLAGELTSSEDLGLESKLASLLLLIGSLNIALFAFNLIPLLPLDGGRMLSAVYEAIKRSSFRVVGKPDPGPVDSAKALPLAYLVWIALIFIGLTLVLADLTNPIGL